MIPWQFYVGGALLISALSFGTGWTVREWKADSDQLASVKAGIEQGKKDQELADFRAGRYEEQRYDANQASLMRDTEIRTIYRSIEVPVECEPPAAALSVLDSAIESAAAQVAGQPFPTVPATSPEAEPIH